MKDLYYRAAAELTVAGNSSWEYLADKHSTPPVTVSKKPDPTADKITDLAIFQGVQGFAKIGALFMLLFAGWKLIQHLAKPDTAKQGTIIPAIRSVIPLLLVAILLWDLSLMLKLAGLLGQFANWISSAITDLTKP